ncbi:MAG: ParB/RepB/Spo0J family partition protein [bacterium]|nr:ParB/RepB/Spo0J family partition protein [bacterium]
MASKTKRLGSLADIYQSENLDGTITTIKLDRIHPSAEQPRQNRTAGVDELAESIRRDGLLSPLVVTKDGDKYRIIAGERRYHALTKLGKTQAECRIISREERDYWRIAIVENLQRENLSADEEAQALLRLKKQDNLSDEGLAKLVGKSRNYITEILGIAQLPANVLKECQAVGIDNRNLMIQVVQSYKKGNVAEFLDAYRQGAVRTVRAAREFNRAPESATAAAPQKTKNPPGKAGKADTEAQLFKDYSIKVRGSEVRVKCPDPEDAERLEKHIRQNFLKKARAKK